MKSGLFLTVFYLCCFCCFFLFFSELCLCVSRITRLMMINIQTVWNLLKRGIRESTKWEQIYWDCIVDFHLFSVLSENQTDGKQLKLLVRNGNKKESNLATIADFCHRYLNICNSYTAHLFRLHMHSRLFTHSPCAPCSLCLSQNT